MNTYTIHIKKRHTVVMYYGNMYLLNIFGKVEFYNEKKNIPIAAQDVYPCYGN